MTEYYDSSIEVLMPAFFKNAAEVQAISYAIQTQIRKLCIYMKKAMVYAAIDSLEEEMLDLLALELGSQYYSEDMDIETKRAIIKNTMMWYTKAGTPSAVKELVEIVFREGDVVEWFDYTEGPYTPGTFDIVTSARMTEDIADYFLSIVQDVKNSKAHIRRILIDREADLTVYAGLGAYASPHITITNSPQIEKTVSTMPRTATAAVTSTRTTVYNGAV